MDYTTYPLLRGGIAVGPIRLSPYNGTAGPIVRYGGETMILSCHHVFVADYHHTPQDPIGQPSQSGIKVARLHDEAAFGAKADAALAVIDNPANSRNEIHELHELGIQPKRFAEESDVKDLIESGGRVWKRGIATMVTDGKILRDDARVSVKYELIGKEKIKNDQLLIQRLSPGGPFSMGGDSGSCVIRDDGTVIGIVIAGEGQFSYATPIYRLREIFKGISL